MKNAHTAVLWTAEKWTCHAATTVTSTDDCVTGKRIIADCESEDDARLIAAAPELLAALQALLPAYREAVRLYDSNHHDAFTAKAHNAIAKAKKGQP